MHLRLKETFGEVQVQLLRFCLRSITFLLRMSEMGGCTVQQLLRRKHGMLVHHGVHEGLYCAELQKEGAIIARYPDDCLATNSLLLTKRVWELLYKGKMKYSYSQAYTYLHGKDVNQALSNWDVVEFERSLLPRLASEASLEKHVALYNEVKLRCTPSETYQLYDVLVRFYTYARLHNISVSREGIDGLEPVSHIAGLTDQHADCVDVTSAGVMLEALKLIHKESVLVELEGKTYLVRETELSPYLSAKGAKHQLPSDQELTELFACERVPVFNGNVCVVGVVEADYRDKMIDLVGRILGQSGNPSTPEEIELYNYAKKVVVDKKVGKNSLVGLGQVAGEGMLGQCLDRVFQEVKKKVRGTLDDTECFKLAASKLSAMNSAKMLHNKQGGLHLIERIGDGSGPPAMASSV